MGRALSRTLSDTCCSLKTEQGRFRPGVSMPVRVQWVFAVVQRKNRASADARQRKGNRSDVMVDSLGAARESSEFLNRTNSPGTRVTGPTLQLNR